MSANDETPPPASTPSTLAAALAFSSIALLANLSQAAEAPIKDATRPPNIVIIFIDDMGYADIGPFGATAYKTPHLDRMAAEGRIFTDFHSATAVCSASRAALMTGCYPERVSILGALGTNAKVGINADEITLAELCRTRGYATAIYGKWHLGHHKQFLPLQNGFDEYFGLPYSNDMSPLQAEMIKDMPAEAVARKRNAPPLPLFKNNEIIDSAVSPEKLAQLTTLYTEHAVSFIDRHKNQPFLLYVPHTMMHVPLAVSDKFKDKSGAGLFGDTVMELDWSVGQILDAIKRNGLDDNTLVLFTSDNSPWLNFGNHAGSAGPLREGKGTMWEGGYREPCVMRWPGKIPAGTKCDELASTLDVFPTVAKLMTVATILPQSAPSSDSDPTAAELTSLARELCAAEGLDWATALAHAAADLDPLACFARHWDNTAEWQQLQHQWGFDTDDELPF